MSASETDADGEEIKMIEVNAYQGEKLKRAYGRQGFDKVQNRIAEQCDKLRECCEGEEWEPFVTSLAEMAALIGEMKQGLSENDRLKDYNTEFNRIVNKEWERR